MWQAIKARWQVALLVFTVIVIALLCILLAVSRASLMKVQSDNAVLLSDNHLQKQVIATQAFNFSRFNQVAEQTGSLNMSVDAGTEKTVIEYREILRREKTCDLPVPADIAGGLLDYANRLRAGAVHAGAGITDAADDGSVTTGEMTYCQAVLWIGPLLAVIEKGNNNLSGIREIERQRQQTAPEE
ncbi:putative bacteriophage protein [Trabulsiella guamensis ATCC 49490]|uniref:Putative bacteriophage protein n=1 Tax=Trabulsiella guamensis ATCC 49490 TaxID=1005994 RepID=A0A084ZPS5_9ENTR|nr:hypothetical protein [Trabulsiella guamensis]KFB99469.1 putative bacteriophage protein [Trabulsiella guamensis ATCC 49490]